MGRDLEGGPAGSVRGPPSLLSAATAALIFPPPLPSVNANSSLKIDFFLIF